MTSGFRRIAWDRVSFEVPHDWELAMYRWPKPGQTFIELEDDCSICLSGQWQWSDNEKVMKEFLSRQEARDSDLAKRADKRDAVVEIPDNWTAHIYSFSETAPDKSKSKIKVTRNKILHATCLFEGFAASFQIQKSQDCSLSLTEIGEHFICSFQRHQGDAIPLELFDLSITMPASFVLRNADFAVGSKHLTYTREKRTLHIWVLSCADIILEDSPSLEEWCSGFLNSQGKIRSRVFRPGKGGLTWKRRFPMVITHLSEINAWCFRWQVKGFHQVAENRVLIWAFNYRKQSDLDWLPEWLPQGAGPA